MFSKETTNTNGENLTAVPLWKSLNIFLESELISFPSHPLPSSPLPPIPLVHVCVILGIEQKARACQARALLLSDSVAMELGFYCCWCHFILSPNLSPSVQSGKGYDFKTRSTLRQEKDASRVFESVLAELYTFWLFFFFCMDLKRKSI